MKFDSNYIINSIPTENRYGNALFIHFIKQLELSYNSNLNDYKTQLIDEPDGLQALKEIRKECKIYADKHRKGTVLSNLTIKQATQPDYFIRKYDFFSRCADFSNKKYRIVKDLKKELGEIVAIHAGNNEVHINIAIDINNSTQPQHYRYLMFFINAYLVMYFDSAIEFFTNSKNISGSEIYNTIKSNNFLDYCTRIKESNLKLEQLIKSNNIDWFYSIEQLLITKKILKPDYTIDCPKTKILDFIRLILSYSIFKPSLSLENAKKKIIKPSHIIVFFTERYNIEKGLGENYKKHKEKFSLKFAKADFIFISPPND
jgi:hypothetical protein